ncbi:MAG: DedA family protein [Nitrospinae bacterium]|nr:DedA family protein [Nitrospinota bacterium]
MVETLQYFVENYGYVAILVGTFFEGETILVLGGIAAHIGYLELTPVIAAAFFGSTFGDQLFFFIGRRWGNRLLAKLPTWKVRMDKVHERMEKWHSWIILAFRFWYGLRNVTPFALGMSNVKTSLFIVLNIIGAFIWAVTVAWGGYILGEAVEKVIGSIKFYEIMFLVGVAALGLIVWISVNVYRKMKYGKAGGA